MKIARYIFIIVLMSSCVPMFGLKQLATDSIAAIAIEALHEDNYERNDTILTFTETESYDLYYPEYEIWERATLQGKLKMEGLPLSPSLKIVMLRDSMIDVSIRAPFIGEAVMMEIDRDSLTLVNKMNKTFVKEGIGAMGKIYPGGLKDIQDLLLARFFIPGHDIMEEDLDELLEIYEEEGQYAVVPKGEAMVPGIKYGYIVDELFKPLMIVAYPEEKNDMEFDVVYNYKSKGYDITMSYIQGNMHFDVTLELNNPEWKGDLPKAFVPDKKYRRVSFEDFVRNIGK